MGHRLTGYLADACALIDFYTADPALPASVRALLEDNASEVAVVATTVWEIAIKIARGKLSDHPGRRPPSPADMLQPTASPSCRSTRRPPSRPPTCRPSTPTRSTAPWLHSPSAVAGPC